MTLGEKIKEARKQVALSQEKLAEKLSVSRSAVAKWETDQGLPDVDNLKALSKLLNVSIDYLLDEQEGYEMNVMRETYNLSECGKGNKDKKKDHIVCDKFQNSKIYLLFGEQKLTKSEKILDNTLGILTDAPFGIPQMMNSFKNIDKRFYLVEKDDKQFLVTVTDEFIETRQLINKIEKKRFEIGNWKFTRSTYKIK